MTRRRLHHYLSIAALAAPAAGAGAGVIAWDNCNLVVPATIDGLYINVETRATGSAGSVVAGWDLNPYSASGLTWFNAVGSGMKRCPGTTTGSAGNLPLGSGPIGPSDSFGSGAVAVGGSSCGWQLNSVNYFGFRFVGADGLVHYGLGTFQIGSSMSGADRMITNLYYESEAGVAFSLGGPPPDFDLDGDGVLNSADLCPAVQGPPSCAGCPLNPCGECGPEPDSDGDQWLDCEDNCPAVPNANQSDCDSDGIGDACEIAAGVPDFNGNGVPDSCECLGDLFVDGWVNGADLGAMLSQWGPASSSTVSDLDRNGVVDGADLGYLLSVWGPCAG
jgi:hypothetical protein